MSASVTRSPRVHAGEVHRHAAMRLPATATDEGDEKPAPLTGDLARALNAAAAFGRSTARSLPPGGGAT